MKPERESIRRYFDMFRRNGFDLFDDFFSDVLDDPFTRRETRESQVPQLMRTDVWEKDGQYLLDIELPGYSRDEVKAELKDGYLTIAAIRQKKVETQENHTNYVRKERYTGSMKRSFYVGDTLTQEDIKAKYEDGILKLSIPKKSGEKVEAKNKIAIEG